jgi:hypothetical protein
MVGFGECPLPPGVLRKNIILWTLQTCIVQEYHSRGFIGVGSVRRTPDARTARRMGIV